MKFHIFSALSLFFSGCLHLISLTIEMRYVDMTLWKIFSHFFFFLVTMKLLFVVYWLPSTSFHVKEKKTKKRDCVAQIMRDKFECESSCHKFTVQTISTKLFLLWHICTLQLHCVWHRTWTKLEWCQECNERINVVQMTMFIEMVQLSNWTHTHTHFRF